MKELELDVGRMPALIREIAALSSPLLAMRFVRLFGGGIVYVPRNMYGGHPLVRCLGRRAAARLARSYATMQIDVPSCRIYLRWLDARALTVLGLPQHAVARPMGINIRQVRRLLSGFDAREYAVNELTAAIGAHYGVTAAGPKALAKPPARLLLGAPRQREAPGAAQLQLLLPPPARAA